ncbi:hypothetical protein YpsIP31758_0670 [Yersinia pseudotuberculosis IP 31758]|uniref:Uncharacterized protein n=1 Tax=Yersinia pseudotuberculosis serotype O:1b (strain IP 31758) TaxID=349747 RepID=A0A0U1QVY7_YERP3|nr:hypothetical protein YpsIP31758_0670 [Yersinia pseudotuberculosis IP 31758]
MDLMLFFHKAYTRRLRPVGMGYSLGAVTEWPNQLNYNLI